LPAAPALASAYHAVALRQDPPPLLIGERANANGSKRFRERLLADDLEGALRVAQEQEQDGAHAADLCVAYAGRDETADLTAMTRRFAASLRIPTVLDSTNPAALEAALRLHPGRCLINSVNLEDGGAKLDRVCALAKRFGAAVVALTIDARGMAATAGEKLAVARRLHDRAVERHGLRPGDLLFDPLTFTLGAGDEKLRRSAVETLEAIRRIKAELPGAGTILGVSNVSFGFAPRARRVLNSVFLHEALAAGLDAAIIDAGKVLPYAAIPEADRRACLDLLYDRAPGDGRTPLAAFLEHFTAVAGGAEPGREADGDAGPPEERLAEQVVRGDADGLEDALAVLLRRRPALSILNDVLLPAMRRVGEMFARGELLLPFVLQSAEVMKRAVDRLRPHLEGAGGDGGRRVLLATVQGDVHDIGKNLVEILLRNNGYRVINIGTKVPAAEIVARARAETVDAIGLSGLLVQSALVMRDDLTAFRAAGLRVPVLLGGAALTPKFVARDCAPLYDAPVVYCADAFAGLRALRELEAGTLRSTEWSEVAANGDRAEPRAAGIAHDHPVPRPPFFGRRHVTDIDPRAVLPYLNEPALFRARWGYRRGPRSAEAYEELLRTTVRPKYEALVRQATDEGLLAPRAAYGWFRACADGDALVVEHDGAEYRFAFPRQAAPPHRCLSDFFRTAAEGGDVVGFFVVTAGDRLVERARELFGADRYRDYFE
ncbi:MAG: dihydropteroate synthase, partial [Myxococcales bacterium]|nr:dihydropteroate synthase [Myxococcales bacterium]